MNSSNESQDKSQNSTFMASSVLANHSGEYHPVDSSSMDNSVSLTMDSTTSQLDCTSILSSLPSSIEASHYHNDTADLAFHWPFHGGFRSSYGAIGDYSRIQDEDEDSIQEMSGHGICCASKCVNQVCTVIAFMFMFVLLLVVIYLIFFI